MIHRLVIVGAGRLGLSLAADLRGEARAGFPCVAGRRPTRPVFLERFPEVAYRAGPPEPELSDPAAIVFCVRDDTLEGTASEWARALRRVAPAADRVALHTSGARPASVLSPLAELCGMAIGSWHPLAALAEPSPGALRGVTVGIEGDEAAVEFGFELARRVGARPVRIPADRKPRYHAATVFASNYLVACMHAALEELRAASDGTIPEDALLPLARSALANIERLGLTDGATGPLSRGDVETVAAHLAALDPPRRSLYRALGRELLAALRSRLPAGAAAQLEELLSRR